MIWSVCSTHFDEFREAMRGVDGRFLLTTRGLLDWKMGVIELGGMAVMDGRNGASCVYEGACHPERHGVLLPVGQGQGVTVNGWAMASDDIAWLPPSGEFAIPSPAGFAWLGITVDRQHVQHLIDVGAIDTAAPSLFVGRTGMLESLRLRALSLGILRVAAEDPAALDLPLARDALRSQLLDAICSALRAVEKRPACRKGRPRADRRDVLRCVLAMIEARIDEPLQLNELSAAARVSPGTLQAVFTEHFGLSAHRYLMLRRLHAIDGALRKAGPTETVASVCARFGVWDFGRFAAQYRQHFGISPSRMLGKS